MNTKLKIIIFLLLSTIAFGEFVKDHIKPWDTDTYDLGTSDLKWRKLEIVTIGSWTATGAIDFDSQDMTNVNITSGNGIFTNVTVSGILTSDDLTGKYTAGAVTDIEIGNAVSGVYSDTYLNKDGGDIFLVGNTRIGSAVAPTVTLDVTGAGLISSTLGITGLTTATGGILSGGNIVSDTDSTDDLGTSSVYWNNLYINNIIKSGIFHPNDNAISSYLLVAYWPFDGDADDYSGYGNDGTITGTTTVAGKFGAALDFDSTNPDTIIVPHSDSLDMDNITVSMWIKTIAGDQDFGREWQGGDQRSWALNNGDGDGKIIFSITTDGTTGTIKSAIGTSSASDGLWHHIVGTYDGTNVKVYVDGVLEDSEVESGTLFHSTSPVRFADNFIRPNNFDGQMDEVMIFSRALSAEEIKSFYETNKEHKTERIFPVFDDFPPSPIIGAKLGSTAPTLTTFITDIQQYTFDATNDYVIGATEITHKWKEGTIIIPHIHWATNGSEGTAQGVQWQLKFTISDTDETFSAQVTSVVDATIPADTPDRTHYMTDFDTTIDGTNLKINAYICWRLDRIATAHGNGEPAAHPFALAVGFHAEMNTAGSRTTTTK